MKRKLVRTFLINSEPKLLLRLAREPLLAPAYLNFLTAISRVDGDVNISNGRERYLAHLTYRSLLQTSGVVEHWINTQNQHVYLSHDGPLAQFEARFSIAPGQVSLDCDYVVKTPLLAWLVASVLDRALTQVVTAMDRYAASWVIAPT